MCCSAERGSLQDGKLAIKQHLKPSKNIRIGKKYLNYVYCNQESSNLQDIRVFHLRGGSNKYKVTFLLGCVRSFQLLGMESVERRDGVTYVMAMHRARGEKHH